MKKYTLYIGLKDSYGVIYPLDTVRRIISQWSQGFNIVKGVGVWQGILGPCATVTIIGGCEVKIESIVDAIKRLMRQKEVLVTVEALNDVNFY